MSKNQSISIQYLTAELDKLGWPYRHIDESRMIMEMTPPGCEPIIFRVTNSEFVSAIGRYLADHKDLTYEMCESAGIKVPKSIIHNDMDTSSKFMSGYEKVVVKPVDGCHGEGVTTGVDNNSHLEEALAYSMQDYDNILVQEQVFGEDVRVLFIGDEFIGAIIRHPASVTGDGSSTIKQLIETENKKENRGKNYSKSLNEIDFEAASLYLGGDIDNIPNSGEEVKVIGAANVGLGGVSEDITDKISKNIIVQARKAKNLLRVTHAGVDFMIPDPFSEPSDSNPLNLIELNAGPLLAFHEKPNIGEGKPVSSIYLNWLKEQALKR